MMRLRETSGIAAADPRLAHKTPLFVVTIVTASHSAANLARRLCACFHCLDPRSSSSPAANHDFVRRKKTNTAESFWPLMPSGRA